MAETTTAAPRPSLRALRMTSMTFRMATAASTEVPPNFKTFVFFEAIGNQTPYQVQSTLSKCQSDTSQTLRNKPRTKFSEGPGVVYAYAHASALVCRNNAGFFQDLYMHRRERKFDPEWLRKF